MLGILAGAALGALKAKKDDEDLLKGALLGGVLGGATAGLGNALGGATAATEGGAVASGLADNGVFTALSDSAAVGGEELVGQSVIDDALVAQANPSFFETAKANFSKGMSNVSTDKAGQFLQGQVQEEPQQQFQPVQVAPLQQAPVATAPSPVQQMAAGGQPTFVPKAMFEAEVGGRQEQMERERLLEMLRQRGMA